MVTVNEVHSAEGDGDFADAQEISHKVRKRRQETSSLNGMIVTTCYY